MVDAAGRQSLGQQVKARRVELKLSINKAASLAGISRQTWTAVEEESRETEDYIYGSIEQTLGWTAGSVEAVRAGSPPTLADDTEAASPDVNEGVPIGQGLARGINEPIDQWHARALRAIWNHPNYSAQQKQELEARLRSAVVQARTAEAEALALDERMRYLQERPSV